MDKIILHSDLNNFYASVECLTRPELREKAVAVSGDPEKRHGIILAKNQLAKSYGVKTGETILEARKKCPDLLLVPARHNLYGEFSKTVKMLYYRFTDRIEPFGLDECWLDVTGSQTLFGSGRQIADRIRSAVKKEIGLTVSIGVSFSKTFAKLGSDMKKPDAVTVLDRNNYKELAWTLPANEMLYVGKSTLRTFEKLGIKTIGDLAISSDELLRANLGINGLKLKKAALGIDDDDVSVYREHETPKSVGHGTTTYADMKDNQTVKTVLYSLADMVAVRLRRYGLYAGGVALNVKNNLLQSFSKQTLIHTSTQSGKIIADAAFELFLQNYHLPQALPVRALTVSTFDLTRQKRSKQLSLFETADTVDKSEQLEKTMDEIKARYGSAAVTRAAYLGNMYALDLFDSDDEMLPFYRG